MVHLKRTSKLVADLFEELHDRQTAASKEATPIEDDVSRLEGDDVSRYDDVSTTANDDNPVASALSVPKTARSRDTNASTVGTEPSRVTYATAETGAVPGPSSFLSAEDRSFLQDEAADDLVLDARRTAAKRGETPYRKGKGKQFC